MGRNRGQSTASSMTTTGAQQDNANAPESELGSMYDYLAKIILLGPSGCGKSCLLHRFVNNSWRILSSQTIGVEFASKIVKIGTGNRRKRIKLQLWDTAGTERFRSVSRSYYRGAAGAILVYDISSLPTFTALPTFLNDARALASPNLTVLLAGNKTDLADANYDSDDEDAASTSEYYTNTEDAASSSLPHSYGAQPSSYGNSVASRGTLPRRAGARATLAPEGRAVNTSTATSWASSQNIPVCAEVSAFTGENVDAVFERLARMILAKIELGEVDPDDPLCGIQYGDSYSWNNDDGGSSVKSGFGVEERGAGAGVRRRKRRNGASGQWASGLREWEEVFRLDGARRRGCC